jgi:hypothetical protein
MASPPLRYVMFLEMLRLMRLLRLFDDVLRFSRSLGSAPDAAPVPAPAPRARPCVDALRLRRRSSSAPEAAGSSAEEDEEDEEGLAPKVCARGKRASSERQQEGKAGQGRAGHRVVFECGERVEVVAGYGRGLAQRRGQRARGRGALQRGLLAKVLDQVRLNGGDPGLGLIGAGGGDEVVALGRLHHEAVGHLALERHTVSPGEERERGGERATCLGVLGSLGAAHAAELNGALLALLFHQLREAVRGHTTEQRAEQRQRRGKEEDGRGAVELGEGKKERARGRREKAT